MARLLRPENVITAPQATLLYVRPDSGAPTARATLRVDGLLCVACAVNVARALRAVPGVTAAVCRLDTQHATVTFDPARCQPEALVAAVDGAVIARPLRHALARLAGKPR